MRKSLLLVVAALSLGAALATAQPTKDIGYDARANAFEQLDGVRSA
jgi:hypothetical protein